MNTGCPVIMRCVLNVMILWCSWVGDSLTFKKFGFVLNAMVAAHLQLTSHHNIYSRQSIGWNYGSTKRGHPVCGGEGARRWHTV